MQAIHFILTYPATIKQSEQVARHLFSEIAGRHSSFEARRIFTQCAKLLTKRERRLHENSVLLLKYLNMPKRNIRQLASRLAKENGTDQRALEKKIERAVKNKEVRAYLTETLFEITSEYEPPTF